MNSKTKTVRDARRYKYGSISIVFTVVFIALIVAINFIFTSLSFSGNLGIDLTQEEFTSIGDESVRLLNELGDDMDVTIYFMSPSDRFNNIEKYKGLNLSALVRDLAINYSKVFSGKVKVDFKELNHDPEFEKKYYEESMTPLTASSVIIQGKYHFRVLSLEAFFTVNENNEYVAFNGEARFTTAIIQSSIPDPNVVSFIYGHGEPVNAEGKITSEDLLALAEIFDAAGFELKTVNLAVEDLDPNTKIAISYDPTTDLSDAEADKISDYLKTHKTFMAFVDASTPDLKNLRDFLSGNWGIDYEYKNYVFDTDNSFKKDVNISAKYPDFDSDAKDSSAAYQIISTVKASDNGGRINTVAPNSVALKIRDGLTKDDFTVETVLTTHKTAGIRIDGIKDESVKDTEIPLALLSSRMEYGENNVQEYSYVMLIGSTDFASAETLLSEQFGNRRIILAAARIFSTARVSPKIDNRPFGETALSVTEGQAKRLTWAICTVAPLVLLVAGMVVFFRRRHM